MFEQLLEIDRNLLVYLNNLGVEKYDLLWSAITKTAFWTPLFILFSYLIYKSWQGKKPWIGYVTALVTFLGTMTLTTLVKSGVSRIRPNGEAAFSQFLRVLAQPDSYSFFSGHAANSFALTTIIFLLVRHRYPWAILFYIWPFLFSFSRIYVGVHYPSDIFVGMIVGCVLGLWAFKIHNTWRSNLWVAQD